MKNGSNKGISLTWEDASGNTYTNSYTESTLSAAMSMFINLQHYGFKVKLETR